MTEERKKSPRQILFFALDFPQNAIGAIVDWQVSLHDASYIRLVPRDNLHATLVFLGHQYEKDMEKILGTARTALEGSKSLKVCFNGVEARPRRGPRILALSIEDSGGELAELSRLLGQGLSSAGFYKREDRRFWPHSTVARFRRPKDSRHSSSKDQCSFPPLSKRLRQPFNAVRVSLYSSKRGPKGSVYNRIAHLELER